MKIKKYKKRAIADFSGKTHYLEKFSNGVWRKVIIKQKDYTNG
jgi:hypothetical protein